MSIEASINDAKKVRNFILDSFNAKEMLVQDFAIISLFNSIISKVNAINTLNTSNQSTTASLIHRSLVEQTLYLLFILEKNTRNRGAAFFYNQKYGEYKKLNTYFKNAEDKNLSDRILKSIGTQLVNDSSHARTTFEEELEYYHEKYSECFNEGANQYNWFNLENKGLIGLPQLAKHLNEGDMYWGIYNVKTFESHGFSAPREVKMEIVDEENVLLSFDEPKIDSLSKLSQSILDRIIMSVLKKYGLLNHKSFKGMTAKIKINSMRSE